MPRIPRKFLFDPSEVGVYHCINRCVRHAYLCGTEQLSGKCFDHRKVWIQRRLEFLAGHCAVDVLGFSIMSNHIHVVVRNRPDVVARWSDDEVARRWWNLFPKRRDESGNPAEPTDFELRMTTSNAEKLAEFRRRLSNLSWFMRCLVEPIARQANREDDVSGRFFEGRYHCQPILDESALAACLAYVDLNPIRAGIAEIPETSRFTSVFERIQSLIQQKTVEQPAVAQADVVPEVGNECPLATTEQAPEIFKETGRIELGDHELAKPDPGPLATADDNQEQMTAPHWLSPFELSAAIASSSAPAGRASNTGCLPMRFDEYLQLIDWTGRQIRADKRGVIPPDVAPILERLNLSSEGWLNLLYDFRRKFRRAAGTPASLMKEAQKRGCRRMQGIVHSRAIFNRRVNSTA